MTDSLTFGRWMKRLRADLDLTQEALAEQVGCALQTIRSFEVGKRRPSRELAERLAATLQVPQEQRAEFLRLGRTAPPGCPCRAHVPSWSHAHVSVPGSRQGCAAR